MGKDAKKKGAKRPRVEVTFDPEARNEYLTGFHKRKQERRRFGLAMQQIKDRKERLEERKEKRAVQADKLAELGLADRPLEEFDMKAKRRRETAADPNKEAHVVDFADSATRAMFGGDVTVTTTFGIAAGGGGGGDGDGAATSDADSDGMDEELREHKRLRAARRAQAAPHWSLAAVTKRVAAKMPAKKKKAGGRGGAGADRSSGRGGGAKGASRELLARAKGAAAGREAAAAGGRGKGKKGGRGGKSKGR